MALLQTPLTELASSLDITITEIGEPHYDDPSLALLFSQLKLMTLQTAKGTSEISGRTEFNFVLQMARVFCRMGERIPAVPVSIHNMYYLQRLPRASA
jgi:rabconnectin-3a